MKLKFYQKLYLSHNSFQFFPDCRIASYLLNKHKHSHFRKYITMQSNKSTKLETSNDLNIYIIGEKWSRRRPLKTLYCVR